MGRAVSLRRERPRILMSGALEVDGGEEEARRRSVPKGVDQLQW